MIIRFFIISTRIRMRLNSLSVILLSFLFGAERTKINGNVSSSHFQSGGQSYGTRNILRNIRTKTLT